MNPLRLFIISLVLSVLLSCRTAPEVSGTFESVEPEQITPGGVLAEKLNGFIPANTVAVQQQAVVLNKILALQKIASTLPGQSKPELTDSLLSAWKMVQKQINLNFGEVSAVDLNKWIELNDSLLKYSGLVCFADELEKVFYNTSSPDVLTDKAFKSVCYTRRYDRIYLNIYGNSTFNFEHTTGGLVRLIQDTDYPYSGSVRVKLEMQDTRYLDLYIRIPGWAAYSSVTVHGVRYPARAGEYTEIARKWKNGDEVEIEFSMVPVVLQNGTGLFAFLYGPLFLSYPADSLQGPSRHLESPEIDLTLASPPGKITTFTYSGIPDRTVVLQPIYAETDSVHSVRMIWLP
ncbi:MAG: hypothetical protein ACK5JD_17790 [Mangrovibacterium sp.]